MKDYYRVLGVSPQSPEDVIRKSYRKLARKFHPDVSKLRNAEERFKEVNEAWETLGDRRKRLRYDRDRGISSPIYDDAFADSQRPSEAGSGSRRVEEMLRRARGARQDLHFGQDNLPRAVVAPFPVSLEEAYRGDTKLATVRIPGQPGKLGMRQVRVRLSRRTGEGEEITLEGMGAKGMGGKMGDLILEIKLKKHFLFRHEQGNVYLSVPITPWEAVLGGRLRVPSLDGTVEVGLPPGMDLSKRLRLRDRGLKDGDQLLEFKVVMPSRISAEEKELYRKLSQLSGFNPRPWE